MKFFSTRSLKSCPAGVACRLRSLGSGIPTLWPALTAAATLMAAALSASAQVYHSNDLTPAGTSSGRLNGAAGGKQVGGAQMSNGYSHAVVLSGNALTAVDLNPVNYYYSMAMCADDVQQGGWADSLSGIHA